MRTVSPIAFYRMYVNIIENSIEESLYEIERNDLSRDNHFNIFQQILNSINPIIALQNDMDYIFGYIHGNLTESEWNRFINRYEYHCNEQIKMIFNACSKLLRWSLKLAGFDLETLIDIALDYK